MSFWNLLLQVATQSLELVLAFQEVITAHPAQVLVVPKWSAARQSAPSYEDPAHCWDLKPMAHLSFPPFTCFTLLPRFTT